MQSVKLRTSLIKDNLAEITGSNLFEYVAEAIKENGKYYYRVGDIRLEITQREFNRVIKNPRLYYFSTALRLHLLIQKTKHS